MFKKILITTLLLANIATLNAQYRGKDIIVPGANEKVPRQNKPLSKSGKNIALLIGTDNYLYNWSKLNNPINDTRSIKHILESLYDYDVILLEDPTKEDIFKHLLDLRNNINSGKMGNNVNLLMFISGHGSYNDFSKGYIVPTDAKKAEEDVSKSSYIEYLVIKDKINQINAKHKLLLLDVCNGGTFDDIKLPSNNSMAKCEVVTTDKYPNTRLTEFLDKANNCFSGKLIASGGNERVSDGKPGEHSPFAREIIELLTKNHDYQQLTTFRHLCYNLQYINSSTPVFSDLSVNTPGSDYIFVPNSITADLTLDKCLKPAPIVESYTNAISGIRLLILPKQNNYEKVSNTLNMDVMKRAIAKLTEGFQENNIEPLYYDFTTHSNVQDDKPEILEKSGADRYIEVDMTSGNDGDGANSVTLILTCVKTGNGKRLYTKRYKSPYFITNDYGALAERALRDNIQEIVDLTVGH